MTRLPLALALILVFALAVTAVARAPNAPTPPGNAYGAYGCCCPYSAWLGVCPMSPGAMLQSFDDVCVILDEDGEFVEWCHEGGVYPYRGLNPNQVARLFEFRNVGALIDFLCGYDWDSFLDDEP